MAKRSTCEELKQKVKELEKEAGEQKRAEEKLAESEKRYRAVFQGAVEGILVVDIETRKFKYANPALCRMLGYTEEELSRKSVHDIHPKEDLEHVLSEFEAQARGEKTLAPSIRCLRKDGTTIFADICTSPSTIDGRECNLGFFTDITDRKQAQDALRESERRYRSLVENIDFGINLIDSDFNIVMANAATGQNMRKPVSSLVGKKCYREFEQRETICTHCPGEKAMVSGHPQEVETEGERHDGSHLEVRVLAFPDYEKDGAARGFVEVVEDITERKIAEQTLKKREKELEAKSVSLEEMNAALKVLLKNREDDKEELEEAVLSNIRQLGLPYLEKLKQSGLDATQETYVEILESNLNAVVSPFLRRLSSKYLNLTPTEIKVAHLIKEGKNTKDIAELLDSSSRTIERHRRNIRTKLGLKHKKANLRTHLLSMH